MSIDFTNPEVQDALVEAFKIGYIQGVEDATEPFPRVDLDRETLSFRLKLEESAEFNQMVQKYNPAGTLNIKLLEGDDDEDHA